jgi:hypothetical protein
MYGKEILDGFALYDHKPANDQVEPIQAVNRSPPVCDRKGLLFLNCVTTSHQFKRETGLVGRLQQPRSQVPMDLDGRTNNRPRDQI